MYLHRQGNDWVTVAWEEKMAQDSVHEGHREGSGENTCKYVVPRMISHAPANPP